MALEVDKLSSGELSRLIAAAQKRKKVLAKRKPATVVKKKLEATAASLGYSLDELFGSVTSATSNAARQGKGRGGGSTAKVPPKYRDPSDPANTWTGRGRTPRWMTGYLAAGRSRDDFLIKDASPERKTSPQTGSDSPAVANDVPARVLSPAGVAAAAHIEND